MSTPGNLKGRALAKELIGTVERNIALAKANGLLHADEPLECRPESITRTIMRAEIAAIASEIKQSLELLRRHL